MRTHNNVTLIDALRSSNNEISHCDQKLNNEDKTLISTTLRIPSHLKQYYETLAEESYSSMQSVILQVLQKFMNDNTYNNAEKQIHAITERFYHIFGGYGIEMFNIPKILQNYHFSTELLSSPHKLIDFLTEDILDFLSHNFNISKLWFKTGKGYVHRAFYCYKELPSWFAFMQQTSQNLTLKLFFDNDIITNPSSYGKQIVTRSVYPFLIESKILNTVSYSKIYKLDTLNWDYVNTRMHVYGLIEGMQISSIYGPRKIETFQWNENVQEPEMLHDNTFQLMKNDFSINYSAYWRNVRKISNVDYIKIQDELNSIKKQQKDYLNAGVDNLKQVCQFSLEDLKEGRLTQPPHLIHMGDL